MKKNYRRVPSEYVYYSYFHHEWRSFESRHAGSYELAHRNFLRYPKTAAERRQLCADVCDGIKVRRRRLNIPTVRDDILISRQYGRSWKDYTKQRRQWDD